MIKIELNIPFKIYEYDITDSTNTRCKELALKGEVSALVIANGQTQGRGRLSRSFFSPKDSGIYMSFLLRPHLTAEQSASITTAAAVAVSLSIDKFSRKNSLIKWVNDIYLSDRKVCGILCESAFSKNSQYLDYIILGIGINLYSPENDFPDDIKDKAGYIFENKLSQEEKTAFIDSIVQSFLSFYNKLPNKEYMSIYREKSMLQGKKVAFLKNGKSISGIVTHIDDDAHIVIEDNNKTYTLFAGEVSLEF